MRDGAPATAGFTKMRPGDYATFDLPFVCRSSEESVRLLGIELDDAKDIVVTGFGVADARTLSVEPSVEAKRLALLPQFADLVPDGAVHAECAAKESDPVWVEVRLDGSAGQSSRLRYTYIGNSGEETSTRWVKYGLALTP